MRFLHNATEPILYPVRRILPYMGGVDLSPLVVIAGLDRRLTGADLAGQGDDTGTSGRPCHGTGARAGTGRRATDEDRLVLGVDLVDRV